MAFRSIPACVVALVLSAPAGATVVTWHATGTVDSLQGNASLLPFPALAGDDFVLEFSYDDAVADTTPSPDSGSYPLLSLVVTVAGQTVEYVNASTGVGAVRIQANAVDPNLWGVSGCLPTCSNVQSYDTARLNLFFPPGTISSDALTPPPDSAGATVQFGLFSREPADEAFLIASLDTIAAPAPDARASLATAFAVLAGLGSARRAFA